MKILLWSILAAWSSLYAMESEYEKMSFLDALMGGDFKVHDTVYEFPYYFNHDGSCHIYLVYKANANQYLQKEILNASEPKKDLKEINDEFKMLILENKEKLIDRTLSVEKRSRLLELRIATLLKHDATLGKGEYKKLAKALCDNDCKQIKSSCRILNNRREISDVCPVV